MTSDAFKDSAGAAAAAPEGGSVWRLPTAEFPRASPLTGGALDRADNERGDAAAQARAAADPNARALAFWFGKPLMDFSGARPALAWRPVPAGAEIVFLGRDPSQRRAPRFAYDLSGADPEAEPPVVADGCKFADIRSVAAELPAADAATIAQAKSLTEWHRSHRFCARCGAPSHMAFGGWRRDCPACGARHFPRTDPVVIMLITRRFGPGDERVVLGRQPNWPPGLHSLLAGYVEPGETIEEAVRRETFEEAGVAVGRVAYLASQPWPFPSTLMIGCWAEALSATLEPDFNELDACLWAGKSEMADALAGRHPTLAPPRTDAIARMLVQAWVDGLLER